jgi:uncharacterized damage-inducible protein DinB
MTGADTFLTLERPDGLSGEIAILYSMLEKNREKLKRKVGELNPNQLAWQPDQQTNTIGTLLIHIGEAELWWMQEVVQGRALTPEQIAEYRFEDFGKTEAGQAERRDLQFFLNKLDKGRTETKRILQGLREQGLERTFSRTLSGTVYQCTLGWILYHLIEHEASHTGQISSLINKIRANKIT